MKAIADPLKQLDMDLERWEGIQDLSTQLLRYGEPMEDQTQ